MPLREGIANFLSFDRAHPSILPVYSTGLRMSDMRCQGPTSQRGFGAIQTYIRALVPLDRCSFSRDSWRLCICGGRLLDQQTPTCIFQMNHTGTKAMRG